MFIITDQQTIDWLESAYEFSKARFDQYNQSAHTLANYLALKKGGEIAFNDALASIGLQVFLAYKHSKDNPINIHDNCDPNTPYEVGPDQGPSVQS